MAGCADSVGGLSLALARLAFWGRARFIAAGFGGLLLILYIFICLAARSGRQYDRSLRGRQRGIFAGLGYSRRVFLSRRSAGLYKSLV